MAENRVTNTQVEVATQQAAADTAARVSNTNVDVATQRDVRNLRITDFYIEVAVPYTPPRWRSYASIIIPT